MKLKQIQKHYLESCRPQSTYKWNFLFIKAFCVILFFTMMFDAKAGINLASNGKSAYTIIPPAKPTKIEKAAVEDLKFFLEKISRAEFKIADSAKTKRIFVGKTAPSDKKALGDRERRIKSEGNDIYIYGDGDFGTAFAVYDFLEEFLGCRWYSITDMKIPQKRELTLPELNYSLVPSFRYVSLYGGRWVHAHLQAEQDFFRRSRIYPLGKAYKTLGADYPHSPSRYLPPGKGRGQKKPYKYFKDKCYFDTNPEFFAKNWKGERTPKGQLCYSNPELCKTLNANLELIIQKEYKGGKARIYADLNDSSADKICYCPECIKLEKKYKHPAGAYYDYLFSLCKYFKEKYPDIMLLGIGYWLTEKPLASVEKLPDNLSWGFSPLWANYLKPYDHPSNREVYDSIKGWTDKTDNLRLQIYPTTYPLWVISRPLSANIQRLVQNLRIAHKLGVPELVGEVGYFTQSTVGFNELRMFLLAQLGQDVNRDATALTKEFIDFYYGKAASEMYDYYQQLEKCEAEEKNVLRWNPQPEVTLSYLTPANLLKWEKMFDEMEKTVKDSPRHLLNVRRARVALDEAVISVYHKFPAASAPDRKKIMKRFNATINADADDLIKGVKDKSLAAKLKKYILGMWPNGMYCRNNLLDGGKPLPKQFEQYPKEDIIRVIPHFSKIRKVDDAAFGYAVKGKLPEKDMKFHKMVIFRPNFPMGALVKPIDIQNISPKTIKKAPKGYNFYYIGSSRLWQDCFLVTSKPFRGSRIYLGKNFDPSRPNAEYKMYMSLKFEPPNEVWMDQLVLIKGKDSTVPQEIGEFNIR